jgi:uncharacterized radical SAM protein YgiQ
MEELGWKQADIILFSGDAYIDHPSFGIPMIGRMLESAGYKVAIIPQPNWQDDLRDFKKLGEPRLFFGIGAGNMDSMVNHYTVSKHKRKEDAYTPGNIHGGRPDYPTIVYTKILKELFPNVPVLIGGIEASMRRNTHYDYWQDKLLPGILSSSGADWMIYGMGEYPVNVLADAISQNKSEDEIRQIHSLQYITNIKPEIEDSVMLGSHEDCLLDKDLFGKNFVSIENNANAYESTTIIQPIGDKWIVTNPVMPPLSTKKIDKIYGLPFTRLPHPRYKNKAPIPAYEMIRHSINIHRGCFGACSFCTIAAHQGRFIASRSEKSIMKEIDQVIKMPDFKGHISDLGGPSANMYGMKPINLNKCRVCHRASCIYPEICSNLNTDHTQLQHLYERVRKDPRIKKLSIGSGIRYDLIFKSSDKYRASAESYLEQLVRYHVSGRLKVAPEHTEDKVLKLMRKPSFDLYRQLKTEFDEINKKHSLNQQLIPYFISSHPGCTINDMDKLSQKVHKLHVITEQSQDFTPTPMTFSTIMYYLGKNPYTGEEIEITRDAKDKKAQREKLLPQKYFKAKKSGSKYQKRKAKPDKQR